MACQCRDACSQPAQERQYSAKGVGSVLGSEQTELSWFLPLVCSRFGFAWGDFGFGWTRAPLPNHVSLQTMGKKTPARPCIGLLEANNSTDVLRRLSLFLSSMPAHLRQLQAPGLCAWTSR